MDLLIKKTKSLGVIFWIVIFYIILCVIFVPNFATEYNAKNILSQICVLLIAACGQHFAVLNGGVDFSQTSIIALSGVVGASIMSNSTGIFAGQWYAVPIALLIMMIIGLLFGIINGLSIITFKMPSFIVTMATQMIGSGVALLYTQSKTIGGLPDFFTFIGIKTIWIIPYTFIIALVIVFICNYILNKTLYGRQLYAIGNNAKASEISGVPVKKTIFKKYIYTGITAAFAGIIMIAQMESAAPSFGNNMFIDIMSAIIIGGTSPAGGSGKITNTVKGAFLIIILNVSMNLLGIPWFVINIIKGLIILIAAAVEITQKRRV